jgi:hypothetical protein
VARSTTSTGFSAETAIWLVGFVFSMKNGLYHVSSEQAVSRHEDNNAESLLAESSLFLIVICASCELSAASELASLRKAEHGISKVLPVVLGLSASTVQTL